MSVTKGDVTNEDIENGIPGCCGSCPIALALERMGFRNFDVWDFELELHETGETFDLPAEAKKFIEDFDEGRPVVPFSFEIDMSEGQGRKLPSQSPIPKIEKTMAHPSITRLMQERKSCQSSTPDSPSATPASTPAN